VRERGRELGLDPQQSHEAVIYLDRHVEVRANTNGSGGYLYVVAFLREGAEA
jgi:hypothetical protein